MNFRKLVEHVTWFEAILHSTLHSQNENKRHDHAYARNTCRLSASSGRRLHKSKKGRLRHFSETQMKKQLENAKTSAETVILLLMPTLIGKSQNEHFFPYIFRFESL